MTKRLNMGRLGIGISAVAVGILGISASASTGYQESVSGDFSGLGLTPTSVTLGVGSNLISGTSGRSAGVVDRDYFNFVVPTGTEWTGLWVLSGTTSAGANSLSFIALEAGSAVTVPVSPASAAGLLGWSHYGLGDIGTDILDDMATSGNGASGFATPLGAGTYSVWVQELTAGAYQYNFDFVISPIPEGRQVGAWVGLSALALVTVRRRFAA